MCLVQCESTAQIRIAHSGADVSLGVLANEKNTKNASDRGRKSETTQKDTSAPLASFPFRSSIRSSNNDSPNSVFPGVGGLSCGVVGAFLLVFEFENRN